MTPILRIANLDDLPFLLEFEQRLIKTERPMDPAIKAYRKAGFKNYLINMRYDVND